MARRTFNVRFSDQELLEIKIKAKARGFSVGRYIRFRALGRDEEGEKIDQLERRIRKVERGTS